MADEHTLYATTHSLYAGRARSYLIKHGIPFRELSPGHESFKAEVLPLARLPTVPVLRTAAGEVIRDGAAIIEHFEQATGRPARPPGPCQQIVSALFDVIGCEGLLRPAMHYRWNFLHEQYDFELFHFLHAQRELPDREAKTQRMMDRLQHVTTLFGVTPETVALTETLYLELLAALDAHFAHYPYLLGWRPCIGDFGLIAPLYAHLGRDPYPLRLMQQRAPRVYRWVERMNRADQDAGEFFHAGTDFLADDEVPATLIAVLQLLAEDFVPETRAAAAAIDAWLAEHRPEPGATADRFVGMAQFSVRGQAISAVAQPYRFYLLQRVQDAYTALPASSQAQVQALLHSCDLAELLTLRLTRRIERGVNLEVWGE